MQHGSRQQISWSNAVYSEYVAKMVEAIGKHYGSGLVRQADFRNSFPDERDKINAWVLEQTKQRIRDLIPKLPPELGSQVRLILVNAIYFNGSFLRIVETT